MRSAGLSGVRCAHPNTPACAGTRIHTAFNWKDNREDPVAKGLIQEDGIHVKHAGRAVIAKTLADLGYKQVKPPR